MVEEAVEIALRSVCLDSAARYAIVFLEIEADKDYVHFLVQSVPIYSPTQIARTVKSITAREVFRRVPAVKKALWGGAFWTIWTSSFFISQVGQYGIEATMLRYVQEQSRAAKY